jgi:hypothetical protein
MTVLATLLPLALTDRKVIGCLRGGGGGRGR